MSEFKRGDIITYGRARIWGVYVGRTDVNIHSVDLLIEPDHWVNASCDRSFTKQPPQAAPDIVLARSMMHVLLA